MGPELKAGFRNEEKAFERKILQQIPIMLEKAIQLRDISGQSSGFQTDRLVKRA